MKIRLNHKKRRAILLSFILFGFVTLFSSCMMMAPMHMTRHNTNPVYTTVVHIDPVCGHQINNIQNELFYDYNGNRYYFHSENCMNAFKHSPKNHLNNNSMNHHHHHHHNRMWLPGGIFMGAMMIFMMVVI